MNNEIEFVNLSSIKQIGKKPVYNMEVDDFHNFSANGGIILHNCDAARYLVRTLQLVRRSSMK